jgi:threonine dehydrogenase-like Zn-dependent dehydrogenase
MDGAGYQHIGIKTVPTPEPGPAQLLARVDAAGICTSLLKLIDQGPKHPLVYGRDIEKHPLILGDEGSVTIVQVGAHLHGRYCEGQRYVIQPAVDHGPINHPELYPNDGKSVVKVAVGYTLPGHLAEYILITEETLEAGCLLPLPDSEIPYAHAAMAEPFSCVISAQDHHQHLEQASPLRPRREVKGLKKNGVTVIIGAGAMGRMHVDLAISYRPKHIVIVDINQERLHLVNRLFSGHAQKAGIALHTVIADAKPLVDRLTNSRGADDVIVAVGSAAAMQAALELTGRGAVLNLFGGLKKGEDLVSFDTSIIHYREINITGSSGGSPWDLARTLDLMARREINARQHITRIGDLDHAVQLLESVKAQALDGKAVVYPHRRTDEIKPVTGWSAEDEKHYLTAR